MKTIGNCFILLLMVVFGAASAAAHTFYVTNTNDSGAGSLRQAILDTASNFGPDEVLFNIPVADGGYQTATHNGTTYHYWLIQCTGGGFSGPSDDTGGTVIDGDTQLSYLATAYGVTSQEAKTTYGNTFGPQVMIDGLDGGVAEVGFPLGISSYAQIKNLIISRFTNAAITMYSGSAGPGYNQVKGCYIGTDPTGTVAKGNKDGITIIIEKYCTIEGNVISGNTQQGINPQQSSSCEIASNYIGTDPSGSSAVPNGGCGVLIYNSYNCRVHDNVLSGNGSDGLQLGEAAVSCEVYANKIGTNTGGTAGLPNGDCGIDIWKNSHGNIIGGLTAGQGNVISSNEDMGIGIYGSSYNQVLGNVIGLNATGSSALGNNKDGIWVNEYIEGPGVGSQYNIFCANIIGGNGQRGIAINGTLESHNTIIGNFIGTDATGGQLIPNNQGGINFSNFSNSNVIGGRSAAERNIVACNAAQVALAIDGSSNEVVGNFIGVKANGAETFTNLVGIYLNSRAHNNVIGGETADSANVIGGSSGCELGITGAGAKYNRILGNYIGTNAAGQNLGNGPIGIYITGQNESTRIGPNNVIANHSQAAIVLTQEAKYITITQNNFTGLAQMYFAYFDGSNCAIGHPTISEAVYSQETANISLTGTATSEAVVEVYDIPSSVEAYFIGSTEADSSGAWSVIINFAATREVAATATDPAGNTSAFSAYQTVTVITTTSTTATTTTTTTSTTTTSTTTTTITTEAVVLEEATAAVIKLDAALPTSTNIKVIITEVIGGREEKIGEAFFPDVPSGHQLLTINSSTIVGGSFKIGRVYKVRVQSNSRLIKTMSFSPYD